MDKPGLEQFYSGDAAWKNLADLCRGRSASYDRTADLVRLLGGDEELADVVYFRLGGQAVERLDEKVPALSGLTVRECLANPATVRRLREMLLRMP